MGNVWELGLHVLLEVGLDGFEEAEELVRAEGVDDLVDELLDREVQLGVEQAALLHFKFKYYY